MSQKAESAGTGANEQEETTASESSTQVKTLVANTVKECLADITAGIAATVNDTIEGKFVSFKRQFIDEIASSLESALKKVKRDPHRFNKKGHQQQFRHQEDILDKMESAKEALEKSAIDIAKEKMNEGIDLISRRMKIIKIADRSEFGWVTVKEYEADDLASNSDDERRLYRCEKRAERAILKVKRSKRTRLFVKQNQLPHQRQSAPMTAANSQFRQTDINKFGPCFKISIGDYACFFVFKLKGEMLSLNNAAFSNFVGLLLDFLRDQRQHANILHGLHKFVFICSF